VNFWVGGTKKPGVKKVEKKKKKKNVPKNVGGKQRGEKTARKAIFLMKGKKGDGEEREFPSRPIERPPHERPGSEGDRPAWGGEKKRQGKDGGKGEITQQGKKFHHLLHKEKKETKTVI